MDFAHQARTVPWLGLVIDGVWPGIEDEALLGSTFACAGFVGFVPICSFLRCHCRRDLRTPVAPGMKSVHLQSLPLSHHIFILYLYIIYIHIVHRCSTPHCSGANEILSNTFSPRNKLAN